MTSFVTNFLGTLRDTYSNSEIGKRVNSATSAAGTTIASGISSTAHYVINTPLGKKAVEVVNNVKDAATNKAIEVVLPKLNKVLFASTKWDDNAQQVISIFKTFRSNFRLVRENHLCGKSEEILERLHQFRSKLFFVYPDIDNVHLLTKEQRLALIKEHIDKDFARLEENARNNLIEVLFHFYQLGNINNYNIRGEGPEPIIIDGVGRANIRKFRDDTILIELPETCRKYIELDEIFKKYENDEAGIAQNTASWFGADMPGADLLKIYNAQDDIPTLFRRLKEWLDLQWPGFSGKASDYAIKQAASAACFLLKQLHPNRAARKAIEEFIEDFTDVDYQDNPKEALYAAVNKFLDFCTNNPLYVNNWQIPGTGTKFARKKFPRHDPDRPFHRNLIRARRMEQAQRNSPKEAAKTDKEIFEENKELFVHNSRHFILMKFLWETFCGLPSPSDDFYCQLIDGTTPGKAKTLFFRSLNNTSNLGSVRYFFAQVLYQVLMPVSKFIVHLATDTMTDEVRHYIRHQKKKNFEDAENSFIDFIEKMLGDISGSYNDIISLNLNKGTLDQSLGEVLEKPSLFENQTPRQIQTKIASLVLKKVLDKADFASLAYDLFDKMHIHTDSTFSRILWFPVQSIIFACKYAIYLVLFPPSWILRLLVGMAGRYFIEKENPVGMVVAASGDKIKEPNALTFAINQIIYNMLEDFIDDLENPNAKPADKIPTMDKKKKQKLLNILQLFIQVVEKSSCHNFDDLKDLLNNNTLLKSWIDSAKKAGLESSQDVVAQFLLIGFRTIINEEQFEKQLTNFMGAVNRSFEIGNTVDKKVFVELESAIGEQLRYLRLLAVTRVIDENFGESGDALSKSTTKAVTRIKSSTKSFASEMLAHFDLAKKAVMKSKDYFQDNIKSSSRRFQKLANKIQKSLEKISKNVSGLLGDSIEFQENQNDAKRLKGAAQVLQNIRQELAQNCSEIDTLIETISKKANSITQLQKTIIPAFGKKYAIFKQASNYFDQGIYTLNTLLEMEKKLKEHDFSYLAVEYPQIEQEWRSIAIDYQKKLFELVSLMHVKELKKKFAELEYAGSSALFQTKLAEAQAYFQTYLKHRNHETNALFQQAWSKLEVFADPEYFDSAAINKIIKKTKEDLPKDQDYLKREMKDFCVKVVKAFALQDQIFIQMPKSLNIEIERSIDLAKEKLKALTTWADNLEVPPIYAFDILKDGPIKSFLISAAASMTKGPTEQITQLMNKAPVGKHAINSILHSILKGDFAKT